VTLQEAAQKALDVQDAVNLSGVAVRFREVVVDALWAEAARRQEGTHWVNEHPVSALFAFKLAALAGVEPMDEASLDRYREVLKACQEIASGRS
jgi:hypothetical protein